MKTLKPVLLILSVVLAGCAVSDRSNSTADYYYLNPQKNPAHLGRVAIVELKNKSTYPRACLDVTEELFRALQKKQLFSLSIVHRTDPAWKSLQENWFPGAPRQAGAFDEPLAKSPQEFSGLIKKLKCNAVLVGTLTQYRPYPHLVLGLRLKLIDLRDGRLVWALEQVWDADDKTTERRIKEYYAETIHSGIGSLDKQLITVSSLEFIKFAAYEVANTLSNS